MGKEREKEKSIIIDFKINIGSGQGKEYYGNGKLMFEGDYLYGQRNR